MTFRPTPPAPKTATDCPGLTRWTPAPTASTTPAPSWPSTQGSGMGRSPVMACRSLWHTPLAPRRTSTSPSRGSRTASGSTESGSRTAFRTAAWAVGMGHLLLGWRTITAAAPSGARGPAVQRRTGASVDRRSPARAGATRPASWPRPGWISGPEASAPGAGTEPAPEHGTGRAAAPERRHPARYAPQVLGVGRPEARLEARLLDPHHPEVCAHAGRERDEREAPRGGRQRGAPEREHEPGVERVAGAEIRPCQDERGPRAAPRPAAAGEQKPAARREREADDAGHDSRGTHLASAAPSP